MAGGGGLTLSAVEQNGRCAPGRLWEYVRVLGKSRRKTFLGSLLQLPGTWILVMGATFTLGVFLTLWEPLTDDEELGMVLMVPLNLLLLLWGTSWTGLFRLPTALFRLLRLRRTEKSARFYLSYMEECQDMIRTSCPYKAVRDVYEGRRAFFLQMEGSRFLILQKDCFMTGEPGAFRRLMDEKCGKPVNKL